MLKHKIINGKDWIWSPSVAFVHKIWSKQFAFLVTLFLEKLMFLYLLSHQLHGYKHFINGQSYSWHSKQCAEEKKNLRIPTLDSKGCKPIHTALEKAMLHFWIEIYRTYVFVVSETFFHNTWAKQNKAAHRCAAAVKIINKANSIQG